MLSLGPVPLSVVLIALGLACAAGTAHVLARSSPRFAGLAVINPLLDLLLVGLLLARLAFVLRWWRHYADAPWTVLYIQDGGFIVWPGVVGALAFGFWRTRARRAQRQLLAASVLSGLLAWLGASLLLEQHRQRSLDLAATPALLTLAGEAAHLQDFAGRPRVINLWATWCPPCRREMPVLAAAQAAHAEVAFVFVDQGETAAKVSRYLAASGLDLRNVLLDATGGTGTALQTQGLPATFFFDADDQLVATHFGPLSAASLAARLSRLGVGAR